MMNKEFREQLAAVPKNVLEILWDNGFDDVEIIAKTPISEMLLATNLKETTINNIKFLATRALGNKL